MSGDSIDWAGQDWEDLTPRLMLLAVVRLSRPGSHADAREPSARAAEAQDFVDAAITKVLSGRSAWDPADGTLFEHLAGMVASDISDQTGSTMGRLSGAARGDGGSADPQREAWRTERRALLDHLYDKDEKLGEMASLMLLENCLDTAELANALEVVPMEVTNLRRRMKREVQAFIAGHPT